jgi:hypothetical protein
MSAIRHDGYAIRDMSFQLSLMVLGVKMYIETEEIWATKICLYKQFFGEFEKNIRPALLNLAINLRSADDQIRSHPDSLKTFEEIACEYCGYSMQSPFQPHNDYTLSGLAKNQFPH